MSSIEVTVIHKESRQEGVASIYANGTVAVWYGAPDGSDDKIIGFEEFNQEFLVTGYEQ